MFEDDYDDDDSALGKAMRFLGGDHPDIDDIVQDAIDEVGTQEFCQALIDTFGDDGGLDLMADLGVL